MAVYDLLRELPLWIHARLVPLHKCYWQAVRWLATLPALGGLLESSPALFAVVVQYLSAGAIRGEQYSDLLITLRGRQRDLLRWLGLGSTEAQCKILRKFARYDLSYSQWRTVGRNLAIPETSRVLSQAPIVSVEVIHFLADDRLPRVLTPVAQAQCVTHLINKGDCFHGSDQDMHGLLSIGLLYRRFGLSRSPFDSLKALRRLARQRDMLLDDLTMMGGPVTDLLGMTRILAPRDLVAEGQLMQHCIGAQQYIIDGLLGRSCYYRVYHPTRATVGLKRGGSGAWEIDQIKGPGNKPIQSAALSGIIGSLTRVGVKAGPKYLSPKPPAFK